MITPPRHLSSHQWIRPKDLTNGWTDAGFIIFLLIIAALIKIYRCSGVQSIVHLNAEIQNIWKQVSENCFFLGPRGPLKVIPSTRFYFSHLQRHRHKGTATKAPPQRAPPTKIVQTNFRQESFVSLDRSNTLVNHGDAYTIVIVT